MRKEHVERRVFRLDFRHSKVHGKPKPVVPIANCCKHLGDLPRNGIYFTGCLIARMLNKRCHTAGELCVGHADRRQIDAECLGGRWLWGGTVGIGRAQRRPADIGTVPRQSKIDPILPGKFKDHATVQKGIGQVHRRITSACLEQNSSCPRNKLGTDLGHQLSQAKPSVILGAQARKASVGRIQAKDRVIAYKVGLVDHRQPHPASLEFCNIALAHQDHEAGNAEQRIIIERSKIDKRRTINVDNLVFEQTGNIALAIQARLQSRNKLGHTLRELVKVERCANRKRRRPSRILIGMHLEHLRIDLNRVTQPMNQLTV